MWWLMIGASANLASKRDRRRPTRYEIGLTRPERRRRGNGGREMTQADPVRASFHEPNAGRNEADRRVGQKRIFYTVVGIYLVLSLRWFAIDLLDGSSGYLSPA